MGIRTQVVMLLVMAGGCSFDQGGYGLGDPSSHDAQVSPQPTSDAGTTPPLPTLPAGDAGIKPTGPLPFMSTCSKNDQCASQLCVKFRDTQRCTIACDARTICPTPSTGCSKGNDGPGPGGEGPGQADAVCMP